MSIEKRNCNTNETNGEKILYDVYPIEKVGRSVKSDTIPTDTNIPYSVLNVKGKNENVTRMQQTASETKVTE